MPVETLTRLRELRLAGATVLLPDGPPADVPGLGRLEERRAEFKALLATPDRSALSPRMATRSL